MLRQLNHARRPLRGALLLLVLSAGALHRAPAEQPLQLIYLLAAQSNYYKEPLPAGDLDSFRAGIERRLGKQRCRVAYKSQAEIEQGIENDRNQEALYVEVRRSAVNLKVVLRAACQDHRGKIGEFTCDRASGGSCIENALKDFPSDVSNHDESCHRGKPCRVDPSDNIVP